MKRYLLLPAIILATLRIGVALAGGGEAGNFLGAVDDLPLMPGLTEDTQAAMTFDAPEGRIVEATAVGAVTRTAVLDFYAETLPQLGWTVENRAVGTFLREGERLVVDFPEPNGGDSLAVRFSVTPVEGGRP